MKEFFILLRLHKPIGVFLTLWPALWSLWLAAEGPPPFYTVVIFILGAILVRSAGCVINDYWDRDLDEHVTRTQQRPLVIKTVTPQDALILFAFLGLLALWLAFLLNTKTGVIALITGLLVMLYPLMKRITHLPQLWLGITFNAGTLMAFSAIKNQLTPLAWMVFTTSIIWTLLYDTFYAMTDKADDIKIGIKSTAILFGKSDRIILGFLAGLFLLSLLVIGLMSGQSFFYYIAWILVGGLALYQQWLIRHRNPQACFAAFKNSHHMGWILLLGLILNNARCVYN